MNENQSTEVLRLLAIAIGKIDDLQSQLNQTNTQLFESRSESQEFRAEMNQHLEKIYKELKSLNRRDTFRSEEIADIKLDVLELNDKFENLEQKAA